MISRIPESREVRSGIFHNWATACELRRDFDSVSSEETVTGDRTFIP
jgi:hypothetical protein